MPLDYKKLSQEFKDYLSQNIPPAAPLFDKAKNVSATGLGQDDSAKSWVYAFVFSRKDNKSKVWVGKKFSKPRGLLAYVQHSLGFEVSGEGTPPILVDGKIVQPGSPEEKVMQEEAGAFSDLQSLAIKYVNSGLLNVSPALAEAEIRGLFEEAYPQFKALFGNSLFALDRFNEFKNNAIYIPWHSERAKMWGSVPTLAVNKELRLLICPEYILFNAILVGSCPKLLKGRDINDYVRQNFVMLLAHEILHLEWMDLDIVQNPSLDAEEMKQWYMLNPDLPNIAYDHKINSFLEDEKRLDIPPGVVTKLLNGFSFRLKDSLMFLESCTAGVRNSLSVPGRNIVECFEEIYDVNKVYIWLNVYNKNYKVPTAMEIIKVVDLLKTQYGDPDKDIGVEQTDVTGGQGGPPKPNDTDSTPPKKVDGYEWQVGDIYWDASSDTYGVVTETHLNDADPVRDEIIVAWDKELTQACKEYQDATNKANLAVAKRAYTQALARVKALTGGKSASYTIS